MIIKIEREGGSQSHVSSGTTTMARRAAPSMSIFFRLSSPSTPKKFPKFFRLRRAQIIGGTTSNPLSSLKKGARTGGRRCQNSGGACEIFGEEFSHFFMTNFFDLHPKKKPQIFPPGRKNYWGGLGTTPQSPREKK